jgi:hypothetical protein
MTSLALQWLADAVLLLHLAFIAFVTGGAGAVWLRPRLAWLHLPALAWGAYAAIAGAICPLTPLENALREAAGGRAYASSFIEHYLLPIIYPDFVQGEAGRSAQVVLGVAVVAVNAVVYGLLVRRRILDENRAHRMAPDSTRP